jgi:hypothetical protein
MQTFRQLKDNLKDLPKLEQKEILNKKRLEIKQSRTKRNRKEKLNKKIRKIENIIKEIDDFSLLDRIPSSNFTIVESKYWKSKNNYKMRMADFKHFYFEIYLPNFFNKTRQREALDLFLTNNKENIKNDFLNKIKNYKQELLTINKQ